MSQAQMSPYHVICYLLSWSLPGMYRSLMMYDYLMGRALTWALAWVVSGPGP